MYNKIIEQLEATKAGLEEYTCPTRPQEIHIQGKIIGYQDAIEIVRKHAESQNPISQLIEQMDMEIRISKIDMEASGNNDGDAFLRGRFAKYWKKQAEELLNIKTK